MAPAQLAVADGHTYVEGRSQETAQALVEAAAKAGLENTVKTTSFGYIVPDAVYEVFTADPEDEGDGGEDDGGQAVEFNPADATVEEVREYLAGADEDERERVLAAEKAGKDRVSLRTENEGAE